MDSMTRTILLHIDPSPRCETRLRMAQALALQFGASIEALYASTPTYLDLTFAYAEGAAGALGALQELDDERRDAARKLFDRCSPGAAPTMTWRELEGEPALPGMIRRALYADVLVLGQHDADDLQTLGVPADLVASVLIASGKPALVVPYTGTFPSFGREVLLAWKPTREAASALSSALPLLRAAEQIHVAAERGSETADLEACLRAHGVEARLERHAAVLDNAPGEGLLSLAADVSADLLVMGCYGHGRARELVMGGASRTVLREMTLPVWMAH